MPVSVGINGGMGTRKAPTVLNAVFNFRQFWDGNNSALAEQVLKPIHNPVEMVCNWPQIISKLRQKSKIKKAFEELKP